MSSSDETVPDEEYDALLTIVHGAVVTSGGGSLQRTLITPTEFVLARGLDPIVYGVYRSSVRSDDALPALAILNVAPTYTFITAFGLAGAALGTSLGIAVQNGLQVLLLRRFEGLWPFDRTFLTALSAGAVMLVVMITVRSTIGGGLAIVPGVLAGVVAYIRDTPGPGDRSAGSIGRS